MIKNDMIRQLTLGVGLKDEATFVNYFPGKNTQLIQELQKSAQGKGEKMIYFYGSGGEGRTHLLQACCHEANQYQLGSVYLSLASLGEYTPEIFEGLESLDLVCIDDMHMMAGKLAWEEAFFHFYNRVCDSKGRLIISAAGAPKALGMKLPDVVSRLSWAMQFQLHPLSDKEKLQTLIMRAERRGMTLPKEVGKFILTHCPRHMSTLFAALDALDKASLAAQRRLTVPFVKSVLQI